jgi:hypothetical protein
MRPANRIVGAACPFCPGRYITVDGVVLHTVPASCPEWGKIRDVRPDATRTRMWVSKARRALLGMRAV